MQADFISADFDSNELLSISIEVHICYGSNIYIEYIENIAKEDIED